jgi:hypothetical protein
MAQPKKKGRTTDCPVKPNGNTSRGRAPVALTGGEIQPATNTPTMAETSGVMDWSKDATVANSLPLWGNSRPMPLVYMTCMTTYLSGWMIGTTTTTVAHRRTEVHGSVDGRRNIGCVVAALGAPADGVALGPPRYRRPA